MSEVQILVIITGRETPPGWEEKVQRIVEKTLKHVFRADSVKVVRFHETRPNNNKSAGG